MEIIFDSCQLSQTVFFNTINNFDSTNHQNIPETLWNYEEKKTGFLSNLTVVAVKIHDNSCKFVFNNFIRLKYRKKN